MLLLCLYSFSHDFVVGVTEVCCDIDALNARKDMDSNYIQVCRIKEALLDVAVPFPVTGLTRTINPFWLILSTLMTRRMPMVFQFIVSLWVLVDDGIIIGCNNACARAFLLMDQVSLYEQINTNT